MIGSFLLYKAGNASTSSAQTRNLLTGALFDAKLIKEYSRCVISFLPHLNTIR